MVQVPPRWDSTHLSQQAIEDILQHGANIMGWHVSAVVTNEAATQVEAGIKSETML